MEEKTTIKTVFAKAGRHKNFFLAVFLVLFVGGYALFFSSTYWMPAESKTDASSIGSSQTISDREITLVSWDYSKEQGMMEIEFGIKNNSVSSGGEYEASVLERSQGELNSEVVVEADDLLVVRAYDVGNRWREVSVHVGLKGDKSYLRFYTNRRSVSQVDEIPLLTENEYYIAKYQNEIRGYEDEIRSHKSHIMKNTQDILDYENRIIELENEATIQAASDAEETNSLITTIQGNIADLGSENKTLTEEIDELEEKVAAASAILREYMPEQSS